MTTGNNSDGVIILPDGTIISGHRRVEAARHLGMQQVSVTVRHDLTEEYEILEALLDYNRQRDKTTEQQTREYEGYLEVERLRARERGKATRFSSSKETTGVPNLAPPQEIGKSRDKAAERAGMKRTTAQKPSSVVKAADNLRRQGNHKQADELTNTLNKSVDRAHIDKEFLESIVGSVLCYVLVM